ncbi:MAG: ABC transporter substrate-binding protein [Candidatus Puniceispirillaceae bacterium]
MLFKKIALGAVVGLMATSAHAAGHKVDCGPSGQSIRILASDFPAIHAVADAAEEHCAGNAAEFVRNHTTEARKIMNAALTPNPSEYSSVIVANSTLVQLMNDGLVRPLDDYVAKYGKHLKKNQLITINGKVMAVAFMANSQHLYVRKDILEKAGVDGIPSTYSEVVAAAKKIRDAGIMEHPIVMNMIDWNMGETFNTMFLGHGGSHFKAGTAQPAVNGPEGLATLNTLAQLVEYAHPDHLTHASNETQALWEAGEAAIGIMWGSRAGVILDDEGSSPEVTSNTVLASAPTTDGGSIAGATLWWDGITISTNVPDAEAEATFAALVSGMTPEMVAANNDDAVWLIDGFKPGASASGVAATANNGAKPYPMFPQMGIMHNTLSAELVDFVKGAESAEQALADIEAAYTTAAKEQGFLK